MDPTRNYFLMSLLCQNDASLGGSSCRSFDLTLTTENVIALGPNALFLIIAAICALRRSPSAKPAYFREPFLLFIIFSAILNAVSNLITLIAWAATWSSTTNLLPLATQVMMGTLAISFVSSVVQLLLARRSWRSQQAAFGLSFYLLFTLIFDIPRIRTIANTHHQFSDFFFASFMSQYATRILYFLALNIPRQSNKDYSPEKASFSSHLFVFWALPFIWASRRGDLGLEQLPDFHVDLASDTLFHQFDRAWSQKRDDPKSRPSITGTLWRAFYPTLLGPVLPGALRALSQALQPVLVLAALQYIQSYSTPTPLSAGRGWVLVAAFATLFLGMAGANSLYYYYCYRTALYLRATLTEAIYRKTLRLSAASATSKDAGNPLSLMSSDVERLLVNIDPFHQCWACVFVVGVGLYLLYNQLGVAFVAAIIITVVIMGSLPLLGRPLGDIIYRLGKARDKRTRFMAGVLRQMKSIKLSAYEPELVAKVTEYRVKEVGVFREFWNQMTIIVALTSTTSNLLSFGTLGTYAILTFLRGGTDLLTTDRLFTVYVVMNVIASPLLQVGQYFPLVMSSFATLRRIEEFLNSDESPAILEVTESPSYKGHESSLMHKSETSFRSEGSSTVISSITEGAQLKPVAFQNATIGWNDKVVLKDISAELCPSKFTLVVGRVASGKSTFLASLLGETTAISGKITGTEALRGNIGYCSQKPWLQKSQTISTNITFGSAYDASWYATVTRACALDIDFLTITGGDAALARGLSGGQQARVALARAIYAQKQMIVLDDVFAALDNNTSAFVFEQLFGDNGLLRDKSVVLASNQESHRRRADWLIVLGDAGILAQGPPSEIFSTADNVISSDEKSTAALELRPDTTPPPSSGIENISFGSIPFKAYKHFSACAGHHRMMIYTAMLVVAIGIQTFTPVYLRYWSSYNDQAYLGEPNQRLTLDRYIGGYAGIVAAYSISLSVVFFYFITIAIPSASLNLYTSQLHAVMNAPMDFVNQTGLGPLIGRFTQDFRIIDSEFPIAFYDTTYQALALVGSTILLIVSVPELAVVVAIVVFIGYFIQKFYLIVSQRLRRLSLATKSPLYNLAEETMEVNALFTMRAAGVENHFKDHFSKDLLSVAQKPYYYTNVSSLWLSTTIALLTALVNTSIMIIAVLTRHTLSAGLLGIAITQAISLQESINLMLVSWTKMEIAAVALERTLEWSQLEPEERPPTQEFEESFKDWPTNGKLAAANVVARYEVEGEPALKGVSFNVAPGSTVGICGRTGSGKSTTTLALLRALHVDGLIEIDGKDTAGVPLRVLRKKLSVVVQDPFVLDGSIRENLDVGGRKTDEQIWAALEAVQLKETVSAFSTQLDHELSIAGQELSQGQEQLLAVARVILQGNKIVILDEATANLDNETDKALQTIIRSAFRTCTIVTVAHRLDTIADYDQVLVLENGRLVEEGNPRELLDDAKSRFCQMYEAGK